MATHPIPRRRKAVRRAEILAAAREVFLDKPFDEASLSEIATRADCVEGTIYTYFKNKRDLLDSVLAEFYDGLIADIEPRFASIQGTRDRLSFLIARHLQIAVDDPAVSGLIARESHGKSHYFGSTLHGLNKRYSQFLVRTIKEGIERGELKRDLDPTLARDLVFGGLEHIAWNTQGQGRRFEPARVAQSLTELLLAGWQAAAQADPVRHLAQRLTRIEGQLKRKGIAS